MDESLVLDTSAIFTFTDQEDGCDQVEQILERAAARTCRALICSASLMEVYYTTIQADGEDVAARLIGLLRGWPVHWIDPGEEIWLQAGLIKATHRLSFADAVIAATARSNGATLVHKDPEFESLGGEMSLLALPYKGAVN